MRENGLGDIFSFLLNLVSGCVESINKFISLNRKGLDILQTCINNPITIIFVGLFS